MTPVALFVCPTSETALRAAAAMAEVKRVSLARPALVGSRTKIYAAAKSFGVEEQIRDLELVETGNSPQCAAETAVRLIQEEQAHVLVKGNLESKIFESAFLTTNGQGLRKGRTQYIASCVDYSTF